MSNIEFALASRKLAVSQLISSHRDNGLDYLDPMVRDSDQANKE